MSRPIAEVVAGFTVYYVDPNSTAARLWRRSTWRSSTNLFASMHEARAAGDGARADALRRAAARAGTTEIVCR